MARSNKNQDGTSAGTKAKGGKARFFDRSEIVAAALAILDEKGHEALSLRAIARKLETGPATIYNYFKSLQDVEDAMVGELMSVVVPPDSERSEPLRDQIVEMVVSYHKVIRQHPRLEAISGPAAERTRIRLINSTLRTLVSAGISLEVAALCVTLLRGFAYNQAVSNRGSEGADAAKERRSWIKQLPASDMEMISKLRQSELFKGTKEEVFKKGIETTIDRMMPELKGAKSLSKKGMRP